MRSPRRSLTGLEPRSRDTLVHPVQRGLLLTGTAPRYLRNELRGRLGDTSTIATDILWWPPGKIVGRYLAPYLADALDLDLTEPAAQAGDLAATIDLAAAEEGI